MIKGEGEDSDDANKDFMNTSSPSPTSNLLPITTLDERKSRYSTLDAAQFYWMQHSCQSRHSASHVQHVESVNISSVAIYRVGVCLGLINRRTRVSRAMSALVFYDDQAGGVVFVEMQIGICHMFFVECF